MAIYAISDLHLSFSNKDKPMSVFGDKWEGYEEKIKKDWLENVKPEDVIILSAYNKGECGTVEINKKVQK